MVRKTKKNASMSPDPFPSQRVGSGNELETTGHRSLIVSFPATNPHTEGGVWGLDYMAPVLKYDGLICTMDNRPLLT